jgi:hypothetical protein
MELRAWFQTFGFEALRLLQPWGYAYQLQKIDIP